MGQKASGSSPSGGSQRPGARRPLWRQWSGVLHHWGRGLCGQRGRARPGGPASSQAGPVMRAEPGAVPRRFFGYLAHLINDHLLIKSQTTGPKPETFCLSPAIWCQWSQLRTFQTQGFESTFAQNTARHSSRTSPVSARRSEGPCVLQCPARAAPSERGHLSKPGLPTPGT